MIETFKDKFDFFAVYNEKNSCCPNANPCKVLSPRNTQFLLNEVTIENLNLKVEPNSLPIQKPVNKNVAFIVSKDGRFDYVVNLLIYYYPDGDVHYFYYEGYKLSFIVYTVNKKVVNSYF
jgi:hypothetical protein